MNQFPFYCVHRKIDSFFLENRCNYTTILHSSSKWTKTDVKKIVWEKITRWCRKRPDSSGFLNVFTYLFDYIFFLLFFFHDPLLTEVHRHTRSLIVVYSFDCFRFRCIFGLPLSVAANGSQLPSNESMEHFTCWLYVNNFSLAICIVRTPKSREYTFINIVTFFFLCFSVPIVFRFIIFVFYWSQAQVRGKQLR